ncbi:hypothetical protein SAMN05660865_01174 [Caloramator fervidus]|uniref:Uncharacterized protein n=1 Tax=Caloramator fervidus TaxID=29344 RepID=A0A1H5VC90_9CLOT|nr:hypothetical protein [Caloramator fervidus]SEF84833.1 hypothetical protein SAMN05660865_01174 [Caloramator fervidus]
MSDKKRDEIPNFIPEDIDINEVLKNIDIEKIQNMMAMFNSKLNKKDKRIEVLYALKEFLPEDKCRIVDIFITVLSGGIKL